jgi:hypothetical protein
MQCTNCHHNNDGGNFCENCGARLALTTTQEVATNMGAPAVAATQTNDYLATTKHITKNYLNQFIHILKKPYANSHSVGKEQFGTSLITMAFYSILIPLIFYFGLKGLLGGVSELGEEFFGEEMSFNPPFSEVVLKPFLAYAVFIVLMAGFTFLALKLGKINASFKETVARFGSFLVPFVAILVIGLLLSILKINLFLYVAALGFIGSIFMVPPLVISSFKKDSPEGIDTVYGSLIVYVLTFITLRFMAGMLFESLRTAFLNMFNSFTGF